jgi:MFS transporter, PPP family, 3-phenylpropionic acid transporter
MPLYFESLGLDGWQIGVLGALATAMRWTSAITLGWVADRWRIRKQVLVATAAAGSLCFVPFVLARDFRSIFFVFVVLNLCHGTLIPMMDATVVDHLDELGGDYGRLRLWGTLGFILGAIASAPVVHVLGPGATPVLLLLPNLVLAPVLARLPSTQRGVAELARPPWALVTPAMATLLAAVFLAQTSAGEWGAFFAVHVHALGLSDALPGVTFALAAVAEIGVFHWGRRVLAWLPPADLILAAVVASVVRWAIAAVVTSPWAVVGVQLGHIFTFSALHLAAVALVAELVPRESTTSGQSLYGLVGFGLGGTVGIVLAGALVDRTGTRALFWVEAGVAVAALVPAWALARGMRRPRRLA